MKSFELLTLEHAVRDMFNGTHFSICDVDNIGKMLGRNPQQHPTYTFLRALHCVHFSDMAPDLRAQLQGKVAECLGGNEFNPARLVEQITDEGRDFQFTEDRFIDAPAGHQNKFLRLLSKGRGMG
jgi:hypothetical protein